MFNLFKKIFISHNTIKWFGSVILQKALSASSMYLISRITASIKDEKPILWDLGFFVSTLFLRYLPDIMSEIYINNVKADSLMAYDDEFCLRYMYKATLSRNVVFKKERHSWIAGGEAMNIIYGTIDYCTKTTNAIIAVSFNMATVAMVSNSKFTTSFVMSPILALVIILSIKSYLTTAVTDTHKSRKDVDAVLYKAWDSITLSNEYNFNIWKKDFKKAWENSKNASAKSKLIVQLSNSLATIFAFIPILYDNVNSFIMSKGDTTAQLKLASTLPQQVQILENFYQLSCCASRWNLFVINLKAIHKSLTEFPQNNAEDVDKHIQWSELTFENAPHLKYDSLKSFLQDIHQIDHGRILIQGPNKAGKSTLLLFTKDFFKKDAYYLPTTSNLAFNDDKNKTLSSGEQAMSHIEELANNDHAKIKIFDEWDANLDTSNFEKSNQTLDKLAKKSIVLEVRHKHKLG